MLRAFAIVTLLSTAIAALAQQSAVDVRASHVTIYAYRSGIFGGLGDNHEIAAPIAEGQLNVSTRRIILRFDARNMRVLDPKLDADKRAQVQERMLGPEVLDVTHFPEIAFESTSIQQRSDGSLSVNGILHLHGHAKAVTGTASTTEQSYRGTFKLKQQDFGIKPVSIAGGMVKVKDELLVEFDIHPTAVTTAAPRTMLPDRAVPRPMNSTWVPIRW